MTTMTAQADRPVLTADDLDKVDFGHPVRRGYDPGMVRGFLSLIRGDFTRKQHVIESLQAQLHQEQERNWRLGELLHGRGIDGDAYLSQEASVRSVNYMSRARAEGEQYIRDALADCARYTAEAEHQGDVIVAAAEREAAALLERAREKIRHDAVAAGEAARASSPGPGTATRKELAADRDAASARAGAYEEWVLGPGLLASVFEAVAGALRSHRPSHEESLTLEEDEHGYEHP
jgi:cell division septum initiation protein DivIVA